MALALIEDRLDSAEYTRTTYSIIDMCDISYYDYIVDIGSKVVELNIELTNHIYSYSYQYSNEILE